jgi:lipopolysaccharide export LptBFGC system permease protein LptF
MKNNKMSFVMIVIVIILMVSIGYSENKTEKRSSVPEKNSSDWVKYKTYDDGGVYYYKIIHVQKDDENHLVRVWDKKVHPDKGKENYKNETTDQYEKISYSQFLYEVDCKNHKDSLLSSVMYDTDNEIMWSKDHSGEEKNWNFTLPGSNGENFMKKVCE